MTSPLSTSNSENSAKALPKKFQIGLEISIILAIFVIAELLTRVLVAQNILYVPSHQWWRRDFPITIHHTEVLQPNILFIGNSRIGLGVNPLVFDAELHNLNNSLRVQSYNASIDGVDARLTASFTQDFLFPINSFDTIIWGITPGDVSNNIRFNEQWLFYSNSPEVTALSNTSGISLDGLSRFSALWDYRYDIGFLARNFMIPTHSPSQRNNLGYYSTFETLDINLYQNSSIGEVPELNSKALNPEIITVISSFLIMAQERNIRVIAVLPPQYLEAYADYSEFEETWLSLSNELEALFVANGAAFYNLDYEMSENFDASDFRDTVHLNIHGATKLSENLAALYLEQSNP